MTRRSSTVEPFLSDDLSQDNREYYQEMNTEEEVQDTEHEDDEVFENISWPGTQRPTTFSEVNLDLVTDISNIMPRTDRRANMDRILPLDANFNKQL